METPPSPISPLIGIYGISGADIHFRICKVITLRDRQIDLRETLVEGPTSLKFCHFSTKSVALTIANQYVNAE